ncbi:hypothetical protein VB713_17970 [Anabaena cylindrica UHCC 0172]|uniref:hypothetical protein n=1 Tax=Anabaena cylindrica TaxID=1165 RepID=UPI002B20E124|nr:hypothetical protein [Anabaena cylindrica]MEA5552834.1 hypothetical protein [Anabaena cylindrica UHCC 0172]
MSSGRYQSKLFNFFNQQSQRLTQQWENSFRNLQVATKWSVEALLYPLYQLFQPDELAGKRLQPQTPPPVDAPIQHVLELVQNLPSAAASDSQTLQNVNPLQLLGDNLREAIIRLGRWKTVKNQSESNITKSLKPENTLQQHIPKVRGIAVHLENRHLVLVTNDNKILDVLTIQQQTKIADKINSEIAEYRYSLTLAEVKKEQELLPEIDRILTKLTGQNNSTIKNFSESNIVVNLPAYPGKLLALIDNVIANLEITSLAPIKQRSQEIIQSAKNQLDIFIYGREQLEAREKNSFNANNLENQTPNIPALIEAAINYFFGGRNIHQFDNQSNSEKPPIKPAKQVNQNHQLPQSDLITDTWLSYGDLFGDLEINVDDVNSDLTANSFTEDTQLDLLSKSKKGVFRNKKSSKVATNPQVETEKKNQRQIQPDWIETTATFLGYEIHPLEQILAWLDHVMLWLEMIFMNMIYFFKGLLQVR